MKARPSDSVFEATNGFTCVAARRLAHHPRDGFVDRLQKLSFLPSCYPSYGLLTFAPMGLHPTEYASLRWTHISLPSFTMKWNLRDGCPDATLLLLIWGNRGSPYR